MSIKNQYSNRKRNTPDNSENNTPSEVKVPVQRRNQVFKEDEFSFKTPELESKVMKIVGDDSGHLLMIKQGIFFTGAYQEEYYQEHHKKFEWKTSLKKHDYNTGKYSIDLKMHLNQDFPDVEDLPSGRYRLVFQFYNPFKRRKNHLYGCIDTQSIDFELGDLTDEKTGGERRERNQGAPLADLASLDMISQVVTKVGDVLNRTIDIHQSTIMYSEKIKAEAKQEGYETRKKEEEAEKRLEEQNKTIAALTARLDALEKAPGAPIEAQDPTFTLITGILKKMGIMPDIDLANLANLPQDKIMEMLAGLQQKGAE